MNAIKRVELRLLKKENMHKIRMSSYEFVTKG